MKASLRSSLEQLASRLQELDRLLSEETAAKDMDSFRKLAREHSELSAVVALYADFRKAESDGEAAREMAADPAMRSFADDELKSARERMEVLESALQKALLPKDPNDDRNTFLEIRAGTGGDESGLFAADLLRMYTRFAERQGWQVEIVSESNSELGGYKEVIVKLVGQGAYSKLKFESGGHRVQRVPVTETQGRIHTSACTVAVMPEADAIDDVVLNPAEMRIDTFRASGAGGQHINKTDSAVRITHLPTGLVVECQDGRSQHKNKAQALSVLAARIKDQQMREQAAKTAATRKSLVGSGDRSERIRTYNFPQGRVTDHRINLTLYKLDRIMDGELDDVVNALSTELQAEQLAELAEEQAAGKDAGMTVAEALSGSGIDLFEARLLLESASGLSRTAMAAHPEAFVSEPAAEKFRAATARRRRGEPIAYLVGAREFYGISLAVSPEVLIPRPETELLVDFALERLPRNGTLLDLGTGSGAIALAVKRERPDVRVTAVEVGDGALNIARSNAARLGLEVEFHQGSWFAPVAGCRFDMVVSNPPYVAEGDRHLGQGDLRYEPQHALVGGPDGLDPIRHIVRNFRPHLHRQGWLALEHGLGQDATVRKLYGDCGLESVASRPDLAGIARITIGKYNPE